MRHIESFDQFLFEEVNLNPARIRELNQRTTAVTEFLSRNLHGYRLNERQGSYALGTIIRPVNDGTYDADVLLFMEYVRGKNARGLHRRSTCLSQSER